MIGMDGGTSTSAGGGLVNVFLHKERRYGVLKQQISSTNCQSSLVGKVTTLSTGRLRVQYDNSLHRKKGPSPL
jgi:hypothetical protein